MSGLRAAGDPSCCRSHFIRRSSRLRADTSLRDTVAPSSHAPVARFRSRQGGARVRSRSGRGPTKAASCAKWRSWRPWRPDPKRPRETRFRPRPPVARSVGLGGLGAPRNPCARSRHLGLWGRSVGVVWRTASRFRHFNRPPTLLSPARFAPSRAHPRASRALPPLRASPRGAGASGSRSGTAPRRSGAAP